MIRTLIGGKELINAVKDYFQLILSRQTWTRNQKASERSAPSVFSSTNRSLWPHWKRLPAKRARSKSTNLKSTVSFTSYTKQILPANELIQTI